MAAAVLFLSLLLVEEQAYHMCLLMAVESIHPSIHPSFHPSIQPQQQAICVVVHTSRKGSYNMLLID